VKSGGRLKLVYGNKGSDPHTLSIVNQDQVPTTVGQVFNRKVCNEILNDMDGHKRVLGSDGGLNQFGDSLFLFPRTVHQREDHSAIRDDAVFLLRTHPWMQGTIYGDEVARE